MAFEKIEIGGTYSDFATWLSSQELAWFDSVTTPSVGVISCFIEGVEYMRFGSSYIMFSPTGQISMSGKYFSSSGKNAYQYGYKSKNGVLLTYTQNAPQAWVFFGKTNNGAKCFAMGNGNAALSVNVAAFGEESTSLSEKFCSTATSRPPEWGDSVQVVTSVIPTHPSSGVSYINGALLILTAPFQYDGWQKVRIGETTYMTNGYVALSDD